tara:strand:+ start:153 stop:791 length:639 start_codon:yes stop_codon:yes gene_type:complete
MKLFFRKILWKVLGIDFEHSLRIHDYVFLKKDMHSEIGYKTYDNGALVWRWTNAPIIIGKFCSIANNVRFIVDEGFHSASSITNFPLVNNLYKEEQKKSNSILAKKILSNIEQKEGITIGNDVWIGMGSYIMPGIKVGNGVTIGANSVVTKDIPDYAIVAGCPAKLIKFKHSDMDIKKLNNIAWWNWEEDIIKERIEYFYLSIDEFINKFSN